MRKIAIGVLAGIGVLFLLIVLFGSAIQFGEKEGYKEGWRDGREQGLEEGKKARQTTEETEKAEKPPPELKKWIEIKTFTGTGDLTSESFTVPSDTWRATASGTSGSPDSAGISVYAYTEGKNPETASSDAQLLVDGIGPQTGYMRTGKGNYFLRIISANIRWTVKIEAQQ